jgi:hypothetical protein
MAPTHSAIAYHYHYHIVLSLFVLMLLTRKNDGPSPLLLLRRILIKQAGGCRGGDGTACTSLPQKG